MRLLVACLIAQMAHAVTYTTVPIAPSSQAFFSYSPVAPDNPPIGTQFLLTFPNQAAGSQLTPSNCSTFSALQYYHYTYDTGTASWTGPATGPVYGYFTKFYASSAPFGSWSGISANVAFQGQLGSNSNTGTQNFIQAVYFSTDNCYEYGPEVGFYRLLTNPANGSELTTVVFYYGLNVNCYNVASLGSCRSKSTGASLQYNVQSQPITVPATNSHGGSNFIYKAYLTTVSNWRVQVIDPYTSLDVVSPINVAVQSWFSSTASVIITSGLSGYVTSTQQRNSVQGGITDSMSNPLKLLVYGLATLAIATNPPAAQGRSALTGWCEKGGTTVYAPAASGQSPTSRMFQQTMPNCQVTVYLAGTTTKATIYDSAGTQMGNPFSASTTGLWLFYADNGKYDVNFSGSFSPFTLSAFTVFDYSTWIPTDLFASHAIGVYGAGGSSFKEGFVGGTLTQDLLWTLPSSDVAGCLASNGLLQLAFQSCSPGGGNQSIQYNNGGTFGGDNNLLWDAVARVMNVTGVGGTPAIRVNAGFIQTAGGILTTANSWQAINTNTDGALIRGLAIAPNQAGTLGGYINMAPLGYGNQPSPLPGLASFGNHTMRLWVSATNAMSADTTYGLNTNLYINAAGGVAVCTDAGGGNCVAVPFNAMQVPNGGMFAKSFTAAKYIQAGSNNGVPPLSTGDSFNAGALYWDTGLGSLQCNNGSSWINCTGGGGGGGSPAGPTTAVQYNAGSGNFGGSANFYWNNGTQQAVVTASGSGAAGYVNLTGFIQSENGFLAAQVAVPSTALNYNVIQAPTGGMAAKSFTATKYVQTGSSAGTPALTTSDSFHAGALYWDTGSNCEQVFDGAAWACLAAGGATSPGGANTNVQFNSSGSFGGSANFTFNSATQLLTVTALNSSSAGIAVATGFMQADKGFLATNAVATAYNSFSAPTGGFAGRSFTATTYVQLGNGASDPTVTTSDTFHAGATYYNTVNSCIKVYDGASWACVAGGGGGGSPGGPSTSIQFNSSGSFGGSANFFWNNATQQVGITGIASTASITVSNGYIATDGGLAVTSSSAYNSVQATASGGMAARSFTATKYIQTGNNSGIPTVTTSDSFQAGAMFWDTGAGVEKVFNGSTWIALATSSGGVTALNTLTGALTILGTANEITVSPAGSNITLSTPQPIATSSNVTFGSVTAGAIQSTVAGGSIAFQTTNFNFQVDGNGAVSAASQFNVTGGGGSYKMLGSVIVDSSRNGTLASLTTSGVMQSQASGGSIAFQTTNFNFQVNGNGSISGQQLNIAGVQVINGSRQFVGSGVDVGSSGISGGNYNLVGGFIGQTYTVSIPGISISGVPSCTNGLIFRGGIVVSCF